MASCAGPGCILGGLPVWAEITSGRDADTPNGPGEYWAEVQALYWLKKDGTPGKKLPEHIVERARNYDHGLTCLMDEVFDRLGPNE